MELKSGWNLPPGLMAIPEEKERVYDPRCRHCLGTGELTNEIKLVVYREALDDILSADESSTLEGAIAIAQYAISSMSADCNCWESYDPGDCDSRHEYNGDE